jgi:hypothetical protein
LYLSSSARRSRRGLGYAGLLCLSHWNVSVVPLTVTMACVSAHSVCGCERKHHHPEQIEMAADGRESAFHGEDECARKIRHRYEQVLARDTALRDRWIHSLATTD